MNDIAARRLAAAIIKQVISDIKPQKQDRAAQLQIKSNTKLFFESDWFECLAGIVGVDPDMIRERYGIKVA